MGGGTWKKWAACGDNHGALICRDSRRAFLKFLDAWKPHDLIHVGDNFDLPGLRQGISAEDSAAADDMTDDLVTGFCFLEEMMSRAPNTVYLLGNHEHRLHRLINTASRGVIRLAATEIMARIEKQAKRTKTTVLPYHYEKGVHRIANGALTFTHGYSANMNSVSAHATHFGQGEGGAVIMGHLHRVESQAGKRHSGIVGHSIGCMADFSRMDYASHRLATAAWRNAWAFGVYKGAQSTVWTATRTANKWLLPTGLEEF